MSDPREDAAIGLLGDLTGGAADRLAALGDGVGVRYAAVVMLAVLPDDSTRTLVVSRAPQAMIGELRDRLASDVVRDALELVEQGEQESER